MASHHPDLTARRAPTGARAVRGYAWLALTVVGLLMSFVVGDAVATHLGVGEQEPATPGQGALVLLATMPLVLLPILGGWLSVRAERRRSGVESRLPAVIASVLGAMFVVLNVLVWFVHVAAWAVNML